MSAGDDGFLDDETYALVRKSVPIATVDVLCVFADRPTDQLLLIERSDGRGNPGLFNLIGGRVRLGESLEAAALRHLRDTIGERVGTSPRDWGRPEWVAVYPLADEGPGPFDPRQQSISPSYVLSCVGEPEIVEEGEATGIAWFSPETLPPPERFGFGQGEVVAHMLQTTGRT